MKKKKLTVDNNIRKLRLDKGLTAKELSLKAGLDTYAIYKYEWGWSQLGNASFLSIYKLCRALNCKSSDLFSDKNVQEKLIKLGM